MNIIERKDKNTDLALPHCFSFFFYKENNNILLPFNTRSKKSIKTIYYRLTNQTKTLQVKDSATESCGIESHKEEDKNTEKHCFDKIEKR